ncbi:MAG: hypothetical protein ABEK50_06830 [bacterium]
MDRDSNLLLVIALISLPLLFLSGGCATLYRQTYAPAGNVLDSYIKDEVTPYMMGTTDVRMACAMGESTTQILLSFQRTIERPDRSGISSILSAGLCAELEAHEADLRRKRAIFNNNPSGAMDARIYRDRLLRVASRRFYKGFKMFKSEYGKLDSDCPDFGSERDKFYYLLGLFSGMQAANNDFTSGQAVGVPTDLLTRTARASQCLDSDNWWGLPRALRAVTWTIVPGSKPDGVDPWTKLDEAIETADRDGVRLAYAFKVLAASNKGKTQLVRETINKAVESRRTRPASKSYQLLDTMAFMRIRMVSDRMWTEATGHRTPNGKLGTFWDSKEESDGSENLDSLLPGSG